MAEGPIEQLRRDFSEFQEPCVRILLYGSHANGTATKGSDVEVCLVRPKPGV